MNNKIPTNNNNNNDDDDVAVAVAAAAAATTATTTAAAAAAAAEPPAGAVAAGGAAASGTAGAGAEEEAEAEASGSTGAAGAGAGAGAEGEANNEEDLWTKKIVEIMKGLETRSNFGSFDVQTWLIGEVNRDINSDNAWIKQLLCLTGILILFFIRSTIFVLIGMGAACPQWVTTDGKLTWQEAEEAEEAIRIQWMENHSFEKFYEDVYKEFYEDDYKEFNEDDYNEFYEDDYKEFYEDATPTGWRTKFIAFFSLSIVALRFMTDIVKDMDMAVLGIECLRLVKVKDKPKTTPFIILLLQCAFVARRLFIPLLASIAVVTSMRQNDKTKISYGELYSNPIHIFLQSLAVIFVLEVDEHMTSLFVSAEKEKKVKKELDLLLNNSVASHTEGNAVGTQSFFDRPFESFEIYVRDLNLLNRLIGLICIFFLLVGYFGSIEWMIAPSYNTFRPYKSNVDAAQIREETRINDWDYCKYYMAHVAIPMGIIGVCSVIFLNFFFILNFPFCGKRIENRTPFVDSCVAISGAALGGFVVWLDYIYIGVGFENFDLDSDEALRKACWIVPAVSLVLICVPLIVTFFRSVLENQ